MEVQTPCGASLHQSEHREESQCPAYARIATVSLFLITFGGSLGERPQSGGAQFVEKGTTGEPNRLLVVQTGESFEQAKVFSAHAVPQGLCANLINALKLLANQQEDGDGLPQSIVTKGEQKKVSRTACVNSSWWIMIAPWILERYAEAREHFLKFGSRKFRKRIGCNSQEESG